MKRKAEHAFEVDEDDHAETPREAYEDLAPFLHKLAELRGKSAAKLKVLDPYYCDGSVKEHLGALGFTRVKNENKDAYRKRRWKHYDVLLTNPPYSGDHLERMTERLLEDERPFALLLPNWVVKKPYWKTMEQRRRPFYLVPAKKRYRFEPPAGLREDKASKTHKRTSPFPTFWYVHGGQHHEELLEFAAANARGDPLSFCRTKNALRDLRRKK